MMDFNSANFQLETSTFTMFSMVALFQVGGQNVHRRCWVPLFREFFSPLPAVHFFGKFGDFEVHMKNLNSADFQLETRTFTMFSTVTIFQVCGQNLHRRCWVPLFREFFSPLPVVHFFWNLGISISIWGTLIQLIFSRKQALLRCFQCTFQAG